MRAGRGPRDLSSEFPLTHDPADHDRVEGVLDLLGLLAYAELSAFLRLSDDASLAESLPDKVALAEMAVAEYGHYGMLVRRIEEAGADPEAAMRPFVPAVDAFHAHTVPSDWLEGLVKAYVGDGIAADFYRTIAVLLDPETEGLVQEVLAETAGTDYIVSRVRQAVSADAAVGGRLALWARRLVGEALSEAQRVAAEHEPLARLLVGGDTDQLGNVGRMFARLTDGHSRRMAALGLAAQHSAADS